MNHNLYQNQHQDGISAASEVIYTLTHLNINYFTTFNTIISYLEKCHTHLVEKKCFLVLMVTIFKQAEQLKVAKSKDEMVVWMVGMVMGMSVEV